MKTIIVSQ